MSPCFSHVFLAFYVHFHSFLPVCTCVCVCVSIHYASDCVHLFSVCAGCKGRFRQGEMSKGLVTVIAYVCVGVWPGSWHTTIFPSLNRPPSYCFPDTNFPLPTRNERQVTADWLAPIQFGPLICILRKGGGDGIWMIPGYSLATAAMMTLMLMNGITDELKLPRLHRWPLTWKWWMTHVKMASQRHSTIRARVAWNGFFRAVNCATGDEPADVHPRAPWKVEPSFIALKLPTWRESTWIY